LYVSQKEICQYDKQGEKNFKKSKEKHHCEQEVKKHMRKTSGEDPETHQNKKINSSSSSDNTHEAPSPQLLSLSNNKTLCPVNANPKF
jgi:hypothetical protein